LEGLLRSLDAVEEDEAHADLDRNVNRQLFTLGKGLYGPVEMRERALRLLDEQQAF
jgi:hypothetical protein